MHGSLAYFSDLTQEVLSLLRFDMLILIIQNLIFLVYLIRSYPWRTKVKMKIMPLDLMYFWESSESPHKHFEIMLN